MSKSVMNINIAKDFSKNPAGRYISDGKYSGESFLKNYLIPAVKTHDLVELDFTGVRGYGSSFLEEAFGGLIRLTNMSLKDFMSKIIIITQDPFLAPEINSYVSDAEKINRT